jgi:hypothetical protein
MCAKLVYESRDTGPDQAGYETIVVRNMDGVGPLFLEKHVQIQLVGETSQDAAKKALAKLFGRTNYGMGKVEKNTVLVMQIGAAQGLLAHIMGTQGAKVERAAKGKLTSLDEIIAGNAVVLDIQRDGKGGVVGTAYRGGKLYLDVTRISGSVCAVSHFGGYSKTGSTQLGTIAG